MPESLKRYGRMIHAGRKSHKAKNCRSKKELIDRSHINNKTKFSFNFLLSVSQKQELIHSRVMHDWLNKHVHKLLRKIESLKQSPGFFSTISLAENTYGYFGQWGKTKTYWGHDLTYDHQLLLDKNFSQITSMTSILRLTSKPLYLIFQFIPGLFLLCLLFIGHQSNNLIHLDFFQHIQIIHITFSIDLCVLLSLFSSNFVNYRDSHLYVIRGIIHLMF